MKRIVFLGLGVVGLCSTACQNITGLADLKFSQEEPSISGQGGAGGEAGGSDPAGGQGGGGTGGTATAGSANGGSGQGGAAGGPAGSGGGSCDGNMPPSVVLAQTIEGSAGQEISLDASASSDPEQGTLTFSWEPLNGAPALNDPTSATPSLLVQDCGENSYRVTVTDPCGVSAEATVKVVVQNGGYVAKNKCDPLTACGGKSSPWCEIQEAVDKTKGTLTVRVAGGDYAPVKLREGVSLEGGYDDQFQARSTALDSLNTSITIKDGPALEGPPKGSSVVDGVAVLSGLTTPLPALAVVLLREQGSLTLRNFRISGGEPGQNVNQLCGVQRDAQASGALVLESNVEITALNALDQSSALCLDGTGDVTATGAFLAGGKANESFAIRASFVGTLQISEGSLLGGPGVKSSTALHWDVNPPNPSAKLTIESTLVRGGKGGNTAGLDLRGLGHVFIKKGTISGEDPAPSGIAGQRGVGLLASEVGEGAEPGIVLEDTGVEGATSAQERIGILLDRSGLSVTGGTIDGSTSLGGRRTIGVRSEGVSAGSGGILLKGLERVGGGAPEGEGQKYEAYGLELVSPTNATLSQNKLIAGCNAACKANTANSQAAAIYATQGNHTVEKNDTLVGGPQTGGVAANQARHTGVLLVQGCADDKCASLKLTENKVIAGNLVATEAPGIAVGVDNKGMQLIAKSNSILGGYGVAQTTGLSIEQSKQSEVSVNTIGGGTGKTSVGAFSSLQSSFLLTRNVINACGVPIGGPEDPACQSSDKSTGLISHNDSNTRLSNNYVLGGFGGVASGCELGNNSSVTQAAAQFVYNLCLGIGHTGSSKAVGIQILGLSGSAAGLLLKNNIFLVADLATELYAGTEESVTSLSLTNNDFYLLNNPALGVGHALYKRSSTELDNISQVNVNSGAIVASANVSFSPGFIAPSLDFSALTAAQLHLNAQSPLISKGVSIPNEPVDFDGDARQDPEIGPDERP